MKYRKRHFVKNEEENKVVLNPTLKDIINMLKIYISSWKINERDSKRKINSKKKN